MEKYKCDSCKKEFESSPGPVICPRCYGINITWLNFYLDWIIDPILKTWRRKNASEYNSKEGL